MPQLDQFTHFTQFFWCCLLFFAYYLSPCNDGVPRLSRILKPRNQLVPHQLSILGNNIRSNDPNSLEDLLVRIFISGASYLDSSLFEVSRWCDADLLLLWRKKWVHLSCSCFGYLRGSRGMDRKILYLSPKYLLTKIVLTLLLTGIPFPSYSTCTLLTVSGWVHVLHGNGLCRGRRL
uniref:H(+)-transporting two-sector ATPase n=1 Tax=Sciadopitys verticillata TaxID=28979 RepID=A0A8H2SER0_SCIVE|nr:ATP synthase subunit 8 [Sciadopitys verticillata]BDC46288.1 ATPase subunit 8 [Sciadopitys verticillata]